MRLRFDVEASAFTHLKHQFPPGTMKTLIVSCHDQATHAIVPLDPKTNKFPVDLDLKGELRDTLKFHFFADGDVLMCAGHAPLRGLLNTLAAKDQSSPYVVKCQHNFCMDSVVAQVRTADAAAAQEALQEFIRSPPARSALHDSRRAALLLKQLSDRTELQLHLTTAVRPDNGSPLFANPFTWHGMDGQATTHMHLQSDMEPTEEALGLLLNSGITAYFLNDTLHYKGLTPKEALALDDTDLAEFAAAVCATPQRSILTSPYFPDVAPDLDEFTHTRVKLRPSEHFKRMLSEPFNLKAGHLTHDDCDGSAANLHAVARSMEHMHALHAAGKLVEAQLFPPELHQYDGDEEYRKDVLALGLKIGERLHDGRMSSKLVFMSMRGQAAGDGGHSVGGHVAHSIQVQLAAPAEGDGRRASGDGATIRTCLNEGTNFFQSHLRNDRVIRLKLKDDATNTVQTHTFSLCHLANVITQHLLERSPNTRQCMHLSHLSPYPEYLNVFCHGDQQLGTAEVPQTSAPAPPPAPSAAASGAQHVGTEAGGIRLDPEVEQKDQENQQFRVAFGLPASDLDNPSVRVDIQPIVSIPSASSGDRDFLLRHLKDRASEIHPPLVSMDKLRTFLRDNWSPTTRVQGLDALRGHARMSCVVSEAFKDPAEREQALRRARFTADAFNAEHGGRIGVMTTYLSTDAVLTCAHLIVDDPKCVTESVRMALMFEAKGCGEGAAAVGGGDGEDGEDGEKEE